ncbi:MAG: DUF1236 domain-containing protein [Hyphomicrobiales bacterium]|nr:DUF1236 domain-containing protein [Hyphomicrobiales bacterium]
MRRTWIGAASAAALTAAVATGWAAAQERQPGQDQAPAKHEMEKGQRGETAQAQSPMGHEQEQKTPAGAGERSQGLKPGMQKEEGAQGKAAEGEQRKIDRQSNQGQSEKPMRGEERTGQAQPERGTGAQGAQMNRETGTAAQGEPSKKAEKRAGQAAQSENGTRGEERMGQTPQPQKGAGNEAQTGPAADHGAAQGQAQSGQNEKPPATGQASASAPRHGGGNVQAMGGAHISKENASRIADTLLATSSPQNVNINVSVGGLLPGEVDLRPLPPAVVELVPEYRGYDYVAVNEEIFIVEPSTRRVVEIIREGGPTQAMEGPARINLTEAQQRMLLEAVRREGAPEAPAQADLADGATVPSDIALEPVPHAVVVQIPMIERYRLFLANDQVVLVDPDTREVVEVIR